MSIVGGKIVEARNLLLGLHRPMVIDNIFITYARSTTLCRLSGEDHENGTRMVILCTLDFARKASEELGITITCVGDPKDGKRYEE